jgi:hypothetical protein
MTHHNEMMLSSKQGDDNAPLLSHNIHEIDTKSDQTEVAYQPLLAVWTIQIAICCG